LTSAQRVGENDGMASPKPFQFSLGSIFLATMAIAVAFAVWHWFGAEGFATLIILMVQVAAIIAILVKSKGTAGRGMLFAGLLVAPVVLITTEFDASLDAVLVLASNAAWFAGGFAADRQSRKQSRFVRWASPLAAIWFLVVMTGMALFPHRPH
jgi:hypothetical protein